MKANFSTPRPFLILVLVLGFLPFMSLGQLKTLWLMNGKKIQVQSFYIDSSTQENPTFVFIKQNGRVKDIYADEVFSIIDQDLTETILYRPRPELGDILSQTEMKQFVTGLSDARKLHISPMYTFGGYTAGLAGALVPQSTVHIGENSTALPAGALIPIAYSGFIGMLSPSAAQLQKQIDQPNPSEFYLMGLEEGVKKRVVRQGILGAGIGFVSGFIILFLAN
ncbi:MAG: hypothetical protein M0P66_12950 [Salinivirgaceae bacterium]|nr:hypothetical protein [Salinivirgaceae bacterium]